MSSKSSKAEYLEYLKNLSNGLNDKKKKMDEVCLSPSEAKKNSEEIFVLILNEALTKEEFYDSKRDAYIINVEIGDLRIWWSDSARITHLYSNDSFLSEYHGKEYDRKILIELFKGCLIDDTTCYQGPTGVSLNFDATSIGKAKEYVDNLIEAKSKTRKVRIS